MGEKQGDTGRKDVEGRGDVREDERRKNKKQRVGERVKGVETMFNHKLI